MLTGIPIYLIIKERVGSDPFGAPICEEKKIRVDNVLVAPVNSDDVVNQLNVTGRRAEYILAIPKNDTHNWENVEVEFFGDRWRTFGIPTKGMDHLIPLSWNTKVMVERYE